MLLYYKQFGSGPPLMILHGLFGSSDNWRTFANKLASHFSVYTPDLRNHGRSFHSEVHDYNAMAADVKSLILQEELENIVLMGHSMGGKVAMTLAHSFPDLLKKLIVIDIGPKAYDLRHTPLFNAILGLDLNSYDTRAEVDEDLADYVPDNRIRQFLLKNLKRNETGQFEWKANFTVLYDNYQTIAGSVPFSKQVHIPTLFVRGQRSDYLSELDFTSIYQLFSEAQVITMDAGHWLHTEKPDQLLQIILTFLHETTIHDVYN